MQVGRIEQMETAKEAKESRGPKATIQRELTRIHTPATNTGEADCWVQQSCRENVPKAFNKGAGRHCGI